MGETIWYKGYGIDVDLTYEGIISVQYAGDDYIFETVEDAKQFIDEITKED